MEESHVTDCDIGITHMRSHANDLTWPDLGRSCGIPADVPRILRNNDGIQSDSGRTTHGITRHNDKIQIPIVFRAQSHRMSNSVISPMEFRD